jgi:hypothetical protein
MPDHGNVDAAPFALTVAVSCLVFRSRDLYDLDSVNFALGMMHFDPRVPQPHPPVTFYTSAAAAVRALQP